MTPAWLKGLKVLRADSCDLDAAGLAWSVFLEPGQLVEAARRLDQAGFTLEDISGLDVAEGFIITYHFGHWQKRERVALRLMTSHESPILPSICEVFGGAEWHERECRDFFGVQFEGNPNPGALLLPAEADFHPLVKEEKDRKPARDVLCQGEPVLSDPDFDLFTPPPEPEAPAEDTAADGN
jgi:NADH-quinone oxidoreductase subunit C